MYFINGCHVSQRLRCLAPWLWIVVCSMLLAGFIPNDYKAYHAPLTTETTITRKLDTISNIGCIN